MHSPRPSLHKVRLLNDLIARVRSPEFQEWYEGQTGWPVAKFYALYVDLPPYEHTPDSWMQIIWQGIRHVQQHRRFYLRRASDKALWADEIAKMDRDVKRRGYLQRRLATVPCSNPLEIASIYEACRKRSAVTGVPHHVDHIVPLQGRMVCGLHVHWNLQIMTASENCRKSNRFFDVVANAQLENEIC